jgi:trimethylamine---corrinoid protein Co-methyltransferase
MICRTSTSSPPWESSGTALPATADLLAVLEMAANTTKPLVLLISNEASFAPALDLLEHLHPGWRTPLRHSLPEPRHAPGHQREHGRRPGGDGPAGLPVIYSNFSMAGASTPITAAGTLVLLNAELLAGLVVSQLARPGAPVILGSLPSFFDLRTCRTSTTPTPCS